mmetsp:Transcript_12485/g.19795  ORF Transcript_12485/g.19795 Transcript_12485/m.19795 type:complete len:171 (-) Transcript_12485:693-1205(-)
MFFQLTHTRAPETTQKNDFYSFCSALSDTKEQNVRHFEEDLSKAKEWGQARVEARIQEAEDNLAKKKTIKKSALEIAYDATLESFIKQSERCWNCKLFYSADENDDSSCKWHPGPSTQHTSKHNHLDRVTFKCCGAEQIGTQPILFKTKPCKVTRLPISKLNFTLTMFSS